MVLFVIGLACLVALSSSMFLPDSSGIKPLPSQDFPYHVHLDANYELYWDFNDTHITFEVHVQTKGYIGFGLSPNGGMKDADIVIGWIKDCQVHLSDRHGEGEFMPQVDASQDWHIIGGAEIGVYTCLKMVRKLETCDSNDRSITEGTTKVIYSYHPDDPQDSNKIKYHGSQRRGSLSLMLLNPPSIDQERQVIPDNILTFDILHDHFSVPNKDTTYHCSLWKLPDLGKKHHMIRFEPVIQKGHEKLVHHMLLYSCDGLIDDRLVGTSIICHQFPQSVIRCTRPFAGWATGGTAYNYPSHVGHSLGSSEDPVYFSLETHYNNPDLRSDFVDSSGFRILLTTELRQYDAGIIMAGGRSIIIPPYEPSLLFRGHCHKDCLDKTLGDLEINVFAIVPHSHLLGRKMRTRHFRNRVELPPIQEDNSYDVDYQEMRDIRPEKVVKKGDSFTVECDYDSSLRTNVTFGGLGIQDEMCLSIMWYYPRIPLSHCLSRVIYPDKYSPRKVFGIDWTNQAERDRFKKIIENLDVEYTCNSTNPDFPFHQRVGAVPYIKDHYQHPSVCSN